MLVGMDIQYWRPGYPVEKFNGRRSGVGQEQRSWRGRTGAQKYIDTEVAELHNDRFKGGKCQGRVYNDLNIDNWLRDVASIHSKRDH